MALTEFPAVSCKQRLRAARRLAAGDPLVLAAVYADMTPEELERLQFDPDFTDLIDACRALHALDHAAWRARIELLMRDSVEDALQENRVSTLNTLLRGAERHHGGATFADGPPDAIRKHLPQHDHGAQTARQEPAAAAASSAEPPADATPALAEAEDRVADSGTPGAPAASAASAEGTPAAAAASAAAPVVQPRHTSIRLPDREAERPVDAGTLAWLARPGLPKLAQGP